MTERGLCSPNPQGDQGDSGLGTWIGASALHEVPAAASATHFDLGHPRASRL